MRITKASHTAKRNVRGLGRAVAAHRKVKERKTTGARRAEAKAQLRRWWGSQVDDFCPEEVTR